MRVAFGQSALMEIDCPLFRCLSHWVMKWRRGQPLGQFLLSPLLHRTLCHSPPFDRHWLRQIFVQISLSCGLPLLHKLLKIYCACRALAGSLAPSLFPVATSVLCSVYIVYIYIPVYIQMYCLHTNSLLLEAVWRAHVCIIMALVNAMAAGQVLWQSLLPFLLFPFTFPLSFYFTCTSRWHLWVMALSSR